MLVSVSRRVLSRFIVPHCFIFFQLSSYFLCSFTSSRSCTKELSAVFFAPPGSGVPPCIPVCQTFIKMSVFSRPALFFTVCIPAGFREITLCGKACLWNLFLFCKQNLPFIAFGKLLCIMIDRRICIAPFCAVSPLCGVRTINGAASPRVHLKSRKFSLFLQAQLDFAWNSLEIHKGFLRLFALNPACACEIFVIFFVFRYTSHRVM